MSPLGKALRAADDKRVLARNLTIYEALRLKLGREPTHAELVADVKRILFGDK